MLGDINVLPPVLIKCAQELNEFAVDQQVPGLVAALGDGENFIEGAKNGKAAFFGEAQDRYRLIKNRQDGFIGPIQSLCDRQREIDDQALARLSLGIIGLVQQRRAQQDDIIRSQGIAIAFYQMRGSLIEQDMDFEEMVEMLKVHVDIEGAFIIIHHQVQPVVQIVELDEMLFFIK